MQIQAGRLTLSGGSLVLMQNQGITPDDRLTARVARDIVLTGTDPEVQLKSGFFSESVGAGRTADVQVSAVNLQIIEGANIRSSAYATGAGGNITVAVEQRLAILGFAPSNPILTSTINTGTFGAGDSGAIAITAHQIDMTNGGTISSPTLATGRGGSTLVRAVELDARGTSPTGTPSGVANTVIGSGDGGAIRLEVARLRLSDGAEVGTSTLHRGNAGKIVVQATEAIAVLGLADPTQPATASEIASAAPLVSPTFQAIFGLLPVPTGNAGNVTVVTPSLHIADRAAVSALSQGRGSSGRVTVRAGEIEIARQGQITTATASGKEEISWSRLTGSC
ncbi:MAG: hypothetical protein HC838_10430 [Spirulinaceae cyanobacterium RM2_2_10]|nr:hypothetical protein [Spirulinaceae cyanobacterium RM2_2_10]